MLRWENPPGDYDRIRVKLNTHNYDHRGGATCAGTATAHVIDLQKRKLIDVSDLDIWVVGQREDVPSNAAAMHMNRHVQEELYILEKLGDAQ